MNTKISQIKLIIKRSYIITEETLAIIPPLTAIILAWATKQIIPALLTGLRFG